VVVRDIWWPSHDPVRPKRSVIQPLVEEGALAPVTKPGDLTAHRVS
jgi:hypothetical protein